MSAGSDALPGTRGRKRVYLMRHGEVNYRGTDGESILGWFDHRIAAELRLWRRHMLERERERLRVVRQELGFDPRLRALAHRLPFEWQGFIWLSINIRLELANLVMMSFRKVNPSVIVRSKIMAVYTFPVTTRK